MTTSSVTPDPHRSIRSGTALGLTVLIGALVGGSFVLAKYVVLQGVPPVGVFFWQISGAAVLLVLMMAGRARSALKTHMKRSHIRYYVIGGLLGITVPQVLGYTALQDVPAGLFTMAVTLSPLFTFVAASVYERKLLPVHRGLGLLAGLMGAGLASWSGIDGGGISSRSLVLLGLVPVFLALTNVFRDKAYPAGGDPAFLAAGTLVSQVVLLVPLVFGLEEVRQSAALSLDLWPFILALMVITAVSYVLTFELYRHTDGVGFSQVGYFAILSGVAAGAAVFGEKLTAVFAIALVLLVLGIALGNGSLGSLGMKKKIAGR